MRLPDNHWLKLSHTENLLNIDKLVSKDWSITLTNPGIQIEVLIVKDASGKLEDSTAGLSKLELKKRI